MDINKKIFCINNIYIYIYIYIYSFFFFFFFFLVLYNNLYYYFIVLTLLLLIHKVLNQRYAQHKNLFIRLEMKKIPLIQNILVKKQKMH